MMPHLNLTGAHHSRSSEQQHDLREARRLLKERVRNDWDYPTLPAYKSCGRSKADTTDLEERIAGFRFHTPNESSHGRTSDGRGEILGLDFDPVEWRERQYSTGDDSDQETPTSAKSRDKSSDYKFEGPDSVGAQLTDRRMAKKRKRIQAVEEEAKENEGLAHWIRRRDAWCCARTASQLRLVETDTDDQVDSTSASASSSPRSSTSSHPSHASSTPGSSPSTTPDLTTPPRHDADTPTPISPHEVLVPIAPPLLPNHPIRRKIQPTMYPEIYSKIILQSRTPSVPINLVTLIKTLIQGWKDDGEWPPKTGPLEKSIGRKKGSHPGGLKEGVKAFGRVLRITGTSEHDGKK